MIAARKSSGKTNAELFDDVPVLQRKWQAAVRPGQSLPRYEEVMLGSLGKLADQVDMMVVVGGRNSANTRELTRLVGIAGKPAVQVERAAELTDAHIFEGYRVVGITGGTSTPIEDLETVTRRVCELAGTPLVQAQATALASAAISEVADPAYRSTSIGRPERGSKSTTRPEVPVGAV